MSACTCLKPDLLFELPGNICWINRRMQGFFPAKRPTRDLSQTLDCSRW